MIQKKAAPYFKGAAIWIIFLAYYLFTSLYVASPSTDEETITYFEESGDDLKCLYCSLLKKAKSSIFLSSFGLTDADIKSILAIKRAEGITITLHNSTKEKKLRKKVSGLYHKKILIIDEKELYIGSANCTKSSLAYQGNQIFGFSDKNLISEILEGRSCTFDNIDFYLLPKDKKIAFSRLISLLQNAKKTISISMYALSHSEIIEEIIRAYRRDVSVSLYLDGGMLKGTCRKKALPLIEAGIPIYIRSKPGLNHHKCALIDDNYILGSVNWSGAGFSRNEETFLVLKNIEPHLMQSIKRFFLDCKYYSIPLEKNK